MQTGMRKIVRDRLDRLEAVANSAGIPESSQFLLVVGHVGNPVPKTCRIGRLLDRMNLFLGPIRGRTCYGYWVPDFPVARILNPSAVPPATDYP
jgi:hypothetical protein